MGFLEKLRDSLARTKEQIVGRFEQIVQQADTEQERSRPVNVDTIEALVVSSEGGLRLSRRLARGAAADCQRRPLAGPTR